MPTLCVGFGLHQAEHIRGPLVSPVSALLWPRQQLGLNSRTQPLVSGMSFGVTLLSTCLARSASSIHCLVSSNFSFAAASYCFTFSTTWVFSAAKASFSFPVPPFSELDPTGSPSTALLIYPAAGRIPFPAFCDPPRVEYKCIMDVFTLSLWTTIV